MGTALGHKLLDLRFELHKFCKILEEARSLVLWDGSPLTDQKKLI
jgi:hypothetical protein